LAPAWERPVFKVLLFTFAPMALIVLATELGFLQRLLDTLPLSGGQWMVCLLLSLPFAIAVEIDKAFRRRALARAVKSGS
jgi:Ca2+-transporting ATPase